MKLRFVLLAATLFAATSTAETLRCGSKIVDTGMSMEEVKKHCGSPSSSSIEEQDVRSGNRVVGKTQIHTWYYNRSSGQMTAALRFDEGVLKAITYTRK